MTTFGAIHGLHREKDKIEKVVHHSRGDKIMETATQTRRTPGETAARLPPSSSSSEISDGWVH